MSAGSGEGVRPLAVYFLVGVLLGVIFIKSEVASWFRIQEMFRFQSFHMYGVIGGAVAVAAASVFLMKRLRVRTIGGEPIDFGGASPDAPGVHHWVGGTLFGLGWGLMGACPGPIYALIGAGATVMVVALASALLGVWAYGLLCARLPHGPLAASRSAS